jgi:cytochrome b561
MNTPQAAAAARALLSNYSRTVGFLHWGTAIPMVASVVAVLKAQQYADKKSPERQWWMHQHESFGLLTAMVIVPSVAHRVIYFKSYNNVKPLPAVIIPGNNASLEHAGASLAKMGLHGFGIVCAVTGVAMNYLSGWGLPFFWTKIPGLEKTPENAQKYGAVTYQMFDVHKVVGNYGKYLIPLHMAGTTAHAVNGQAVFTRINPFRKAL